MTIHSLRPSKRKQLIEPKLSASCCCVDGEKKLGPHWTWSGEGQNAGGWGRAGFVPVVSGGPRLALHFSFGTPRPQSYSGGDAAFPLLHRRFALRRRARRQARGRQVRPRSGLAASLGAPRAAS